MDSKIGFDLLVVGTILSVLAVIAGTIQPVLRVPSYPSIGDILSAPAAGWVGWAVARWAATRGGWRGKQEMRLMSHCFLAWLEREVGDPKTKGQTFGLAVVNTARHSGFTLMGQQLGKRTGDDNALGRWLTDLARKHRYPWRRDDFRKWAGAMP